MYPVLFRIPLPGSPFGIDAIPINAFGLMLAVAILVASWLTGRELDRKQALGLVGPVKLPDEKKGRDRKGKRSMRLAKPSELMGPITVLAAATGIAGARLFHILENLDDFARDPMGMLFSSGGLTFFGSIICAGIAVAWYVRKKGIRVPLFADAIAPSLMLGYGIGRLGCYLSGDGDWGICSSLADKPAWIPSFLWSETFPNGTVLTYVDSVFEYNRIQGDVCVAGADGVYPTMIYETAMALLIFGVLWAVRKHPFQAGWLFSFYLVFAGVERFIIEQIRINNEMLFLGTTVTQAELIAVAFMLVGGAGMWFTRKRRANPPAV